MVAARSTIALLLTLAGSGVAAACPVSAWDMADLVLVQDGTGRGLPRPTLAGWRDDGRIEVEARSQIGDLGPLSTARAVVRDGCATLSWPSWPEYYLRLHTPFLTTICAESVSGDRSCSRHVLIVAPRPSERPRDEPDRLHVLVRRVHPGGVVGTPPVEPMPRAALPQGDVDWRIAGGLGLILLFAVAVALRQARLRRATRAA